MASFGDYAAPYLTMAANAPRTAAALMQANAELPGQVAQSQMLQAQVPLAGQMAQAKLTGTPFEQQAQDIQRQQLGLQTMAQANALANAKAMQDIERTKNNIAAQTSDPFMMHPELRTPMGGASATNSPAAFQGARGNPELTGDAFLKTLPISLQGMLNPIIKGDRDPPTFNTRSVDGMMINRALGQYDKDFDNEVYHQRHLTVQDYTNGPSSKNAVNLAQAILHTKNYMGLADALKNGNFTPGNAAYNYLAGLFGNSAVTTPQLAQQALGTEIGRTFRGVGTMSEKEAEDWGKKFATAGSPEQMQNNAKEAVHLLKDRMDLMNAKYRQGYYTKGQDGPDYFDKTFPTVKPTMDAILGPEKAAAKQLAPEDQAAISWAKANKDDPRATKILSLHGGL